MTLKDDIHWFKKQFIASIKESVRDTPFKTDLLVAISLQETGYIWRSLYKNMSVSDVLKLCVGDTIDAPDRSAFPKTKADLLSVSNGNEMFAIARNSLESMAIHIPGYGSSVHNPNKFCHGFGIFQYDLQFFKQENPDFFLRKQWYDFVPCLQICVSELEQALKRTYGNGKAQLTDEEMMYVAIAYNRGSVDFSRGAKQGHFDGTKYYGEYIRDYLQASKSVFVEEPIMRATWFELFRKQEGDNAYPVIAGMNGDKCVKLFELKSRSIAELKTIFDNDPWAATFAVAPQNKPIPSPLPEDNIRQKILEFAVQEASKQRSHAPGNEIDILVLDPLRPIMVQLGHIGANQRDTFYNWCAAWVTYICRSVGIKIPDRYNNFWASVALVDSWRDMGKRTGAWFPKGAKQPQKGDIVCFNWDGDADLDHIGIVRGVEPGAVLTCEGNKNNTEGLFTRNLNTIDGFLDIEVLASQL
jgi:hypothetical protein